MAADEHRERHRRLLELAQAREQEAKEQVAAAARHCELLRREWQAVTMEVERLRTSPGGSSTAASASHEQRYRDELHRRAEGLENQHREAEARRAQRQHELVAVAQEAKAWQHLLEAADREALRVQAQGEQRQLDEHNTWLASRGEQ